MQWSISYTLSAVRRGGFLKDRGREREREREEGKKMSPLATTRKWGDMMKNRRSGS